MKKIKILLFVCFIFLNGCWWIFDDDDDYEFEYKYIITGVPVNLEDINSPYDDYNSALPFEAMSRDIYFSSNGGTNGQNYDIVNKILEISYHKRDGVLNIDCPGGSYSSLNRKLLPLVNTGSNEFGPAFHSAQGGLDYFFYASDENGKLDIKFVYYSRLDFGTYNAQEKLNGPFSAGLINTSSDDAYPTIDQNGTKLFFCSNRENNSFDIYSVSLNTSQYLYDFLKYPGTASITREEGLSGNSNDKCPSINRNLLVFASDREGGYGGYDLWYSLFKDGKWSAPLNFGDKINSAYDEYRPVAISIYIVSDDMMVFSSNRPGGKGGFDLYAVRIGDLIDNTPI